MAINSDISVKDLVKEIERVEQLDTISDGGCFRDVICEEFSDYCDLTRSLATEIGKFKLEESFRSGGSDDYDGYTWRFSITFQDGVVRYFEVYGSYSSWEGYDLDNEYDLYEVREVERLVKVWETIK